MKHIALVEDDPILLKVLTEAFKDAGYKVSQAVDGEEGLKLVRTKHPDIVLLDIIMPKMDGIEVLRKIKENQDTKKIPVFMLTILSDTKRLTEAVALGAAAYLVKSEQEISDVVAKVKKYLG